VGYYRVSMIPPSKTPISYAAEIMFLLHNDIAS